MIDRKIEKSEFLITSDLWPGDAQTVRTQLLEWLDENASDPIVELDSASVPPSVSALQLLVAATRRTHGPTPTLGNLASAAVAKFTEPQIMKRDS